MLTLDQTTLFYWSLSDPHPSKRMKYSVESWAKTIPSNAASRTTSQAGSVKTGTRRPSSTGTGKRHNGSTPALTSSQSLASSTQAASILTNDINITNAQVPEAKVKQDPNAIYSYDGALSDKEEINGVERDAYHASPIKGKTRVSSEVIFYIDIDTCH